MSPEQLLIVADKAALQAAAPGGVIWILICVIICLFIAVIFFVKWMFTQATGFTDYLKTANRELVMIVAANTGALESCAEEMKASRELMQRLEQELRRNDRRQ